MGAPERVAEQGWLAGGWAFTALAVTGFFGLLLAAPLVNPERLYRPFLFLALAVGFFTVHVRTRASAGRELS